RKACQAVEEYLTLISESTLLEEPALEPLRKQLLQTALRYYQGFVQEHGEDPELQAELAAAYIRVAQVIYALAADDDLLPPFQKGVAVLEDFVRKKPDVSAYQSFQVGICQPLATDLHIREPAETLRAFEKARDIWEELVRDHPTIPGFQSDLATWHFAI